MIDLEQSLPLPGLDVRAWADDEDEQLVWTCAQGPRWARDKDGVPEVTLMLYRRGAQGDVAGGQASVTLDLAITSAERTAVLAATARPRSSPPQWASGEVEVHLMKGLSTTSRSSLFGDNQCIAVFALDAETARRLESAWADGLPEAKALARLTVPSRSRGRTETASTQASGRSLSKLNIAVSVSSAVERTLELTADLRLPPADRRRQLTDVHL